MSNPQVRVIIQGKNKDDGNVVELAFHPERFAVAYTKYLISHGNFAGLYSVLVWENKVLIEPKNPREDARNVPEKVTQVENGVTVWQGLDDYRSDLWEVTARLWKRNDELKPGDTTLLRLERDWKETDLLFLKPFMDAREEEELRWTAAANK
jgi:hypothetical protein